MKTRLFVATQFSFTWFTIDHFLIRVFAPQMIPALPNLTHGATYSFRAPPSVSENHNSFSGSALAHPCGLALGSFSLLVQHILHQ